MTRIIERLLSHAKDFICKASDRYSAFCLEKKVLDSRFDELFRCTSGSIFDAVYAPAGKVSGSRVYGSGYEYGNVRHRSYADFLEDQRLIHDRLDDVGTSIDRLEDILSGKEYTDDAVDTVDDMQGTRVKTVKRPSKLKSLYISTVAGLGTASRLYELLRGSLDISGGNGQKYSREQYSMEQINSVLDIKHRYFWKDESQIKDLVYKEKKIRLKSIDAFVKDAMYLKVNDPGYSGIDRIDYDSRIASKEMKDELVDAYIHSDKNLKDISSGFELRYGMHVSPSTISRNARRYLSAQGNDFKSRKEAREHYSKHDSNNYSTNKCGSNKHSPGHPRHHSPRHRG